jgi:hypothetical protein
MLARGFGGVRKLATCPDSPPRPHERCLHSAPAPDRALGWRCRSHRPGARARVLPTVRRAAAT